MAVLNHRAVFGRVHTQNGGLGRVDDGGRHHGTESAAVGDREGTAGHFFNAQLTVLGLLAELGNLLLDIGEAHLVCVAQDGHHQATGGAHGDTDVEVAVVHDIGAIDRRVQHRELLQGVHCSLDKEAHEAQLAAVFLLETLLHALAHVHDRSHVDFVEGGQDGVGGLGLQQTLSHARTQTAHGHALFRTVTQIHRRSSHLRQRLGGSARGDYGSRYHFRSSGSSQHVTLGDAAVFACTFNAGSRNAVVGQQLGCSRHRNACLGVVRRSSGCHRSSSCGRSGRSRSGCNSTGHCSSVNASDQLLGSHGSAVGDDQFDQHAGGGCGDFHHHFVGFHFDQDLIDRDRVTDLFLPLQQGCFRHRFRQLWDFDFYDCHIKFFP